MENGFQFFDILLFALVAVFILLRLRSTLGSRPDDDNSRPTSGWSLRRNNKAQDAESDDKVVSISDREGVKNNTTNFDDVNEVSPSVDGDVSVEITTGVAEVRLADPQFDLQQFLEGATFAYEMVLTAFAESNYETLSNLLAETVYTDFASAVQHREERGETLETVLVALEEVEPLEVRLNGGSAEVTVKFCAEVVNTLRDLDGEVLSGTPDLPDNVVDIWSFARDVQSDDPNWKIIATRKAN